MRASVEIGILDVSGQPVEPAILDLGGNYTIEAAVTNRTMTTGGHAYEAELEIGFGVSLGGIDLVPFSIQPPRVFAPDETVIVTTSVYIPREYEGLTGKVIAKVFDPFGKVLASTQKRFTIGHEVSPESTYEIGGKVLAKGADIPYLNPDLETTEGEVVMGGVGREPAPPPAPPKPKPTYNPEDKRLPLGLDLTSKPEPDAGWEGEVYTHGRIG